MKNRNKKNASDFIIENWTFFIVGFSVGAVLTLLGKCVE